MSINDHRTQAETSNIFNGDMDISHDSICMDAYARKWSLVMASKSSLGLHQFIKWRLSGRGLRCSKASWREAGPSSGTPRRRAEVHGDCPGSVSIAGTG